MSLQKDGLKFEDAIKEGVSLIESQGLCTSSLGMMSLIHNGWGTDGTVDEDVVKTMLIYLASIGEYMKGKTVIEVSLDFGKTDV